MLWKPDPANWLSWRRTLNGWGYSPLDQIRRNVSQMRMVWDTRAFAGGVEADAARLRRRRCTCLGPGDIIQAIDAGSGNLSGAPPQAA